MGRKTAPRPARKSARRGSVGSTPPDGGPVTINDIARIAGVSKKTVSRVINDSPLVHDDTRAHVRAVMDRYRYVPDLQARGLAFRRSFLIGLVYDDPNAQYIVGMMEGVLDGLRGSDYELVVHRCNRRSDDFVTSVRRFVERQKLRGVILLSPVSEDEQLVSTLKSTGFDYVRVTCALLDDAGHSVVSSNRRAVAEVASYLASLGHRRIACISGPPALLSARERREGFIDALRERGLELPEEMIVTGGDTYESGYEAGETLLARTPRPTAIFASNDEMAAGVYAVARRMGLVIPRDFSVVGFDDGPVAARLTPALTTIRPPLRCIGRLAARKILALPDEEAAVVYVDSATTPHLVVRSSCAPPIV